MAIRSRPMPPKDIPACVAHIAAHPILATRYGKLIRLLSKAIRLLLSLDYPTATLFEEVLGSTHRLLGVSLAAFVTDQFLHQAKSTASFWIGPELVKRIAAGISPFLTDAQVRDANSTAGLNLLVWHTTLYPEVHSRAEVGTAAFTALEDSYRGFHLQEIFEQADCYDQMCGMLTAGGWYFHRIAGRYGKCPNITRDNFSAEPRNIGITRELALSTPGSWIGSLFLYGTPLCGFNRSQQRLLEASFLGDTDEEVRLKLGISLSAVKKTWHSIYERSAALLPDLRFGSNDSQNSPSRGPQKKQHLLAYLRQHPEELRPVSRKLVDSHLDNHPNPTRIVLR